jgi:hypothetical protein
MLPFSPQAPTVALAVLCGRSLCSLCLCGENPFSFVVLLPRPCIVHAWAWLGCQPLYPSIMRALALDVGHFRPSAPLPSLWAASLTPTKIAKIIFNVIKCNHFYGQPPSSTLWHPTKNASNVGECGFSFLPPKRLLARLFRGKHPICPVPTQRVNGRTVLS